MAARFSKRGRAGAKRPSKGTGNSTKSGAPTPTHCNPKFMKSKFERICLVQMLNKRLKKLGSHNSVTAKSPVLDEKTKLKTSKYLSTNPKSSHALHMFKNMKKIHNRDIITRVVR